MLVNSLVSAVLVALAANAQAAGVPLVGDTQVTWVSDAEPELHLFLQNRSAAEIRFTLRLGEPTDCRQSLGELPAHLASAHGFGWREAGGSSGTIAAGSWSHRVILFGWGDRAAGCTVTAHVVAQDRSGKTLGEIRPKFDVPLTRPPVNALLPGQSAALETKSVVERDRATDSYLVRLYVRNGAEFPTTVAIRDRRLSCTADSTARWDLIEAPVMQGVDVGPAALAPGQWVVFVAPARVDGVARNCGGQFELGVASRSGSGVRFVTVRAEPFRLEPTAEFVK